MNSDKAELERELAAAKGEALFWRMEAEFFQSILKSSVVIPRPRTRQEVEKRLANA